MVHPIIDEYYNYNPYHSRSSKFVQDKGLVTNEKGSLNGTSPAVTPGIPNGRRTNLSSSLHDSIASTLVPSLRSGSPALSPATELPRVTTPLSDLRNLSIQGRDSYKPQELGNTKKKRKSLSTPQVAQLQEEESPPQRASYGDPLKIAQYFPELN